VTEVTGTQQQEWVRHMPHCTSEPS